MPPVAQPYPLRLPEPLLDTLYPSAEAAFLAGDTLWAARYGRDNPEIHGCALLLLGNRVGGERVLQAANITTPRSFLYRALAAWQREELPEARAYCAEGQRRDPSDPRFERLVTLMDRESFRIVLYSDGLNAEQIMAYAAHPSMEIVPVGQTKRSPVPQLPLGQSLAHLVPSDKPVDVVFVQDFRVFPLGVRDVGAPVVVMAYDPEYYYDSLDDMIDEADHVMVQSSGDCVELARGFGASCSTDPYAIHYTLPDCTGLAERYRATAPRRLDLLMTGYPVTHPLYRDKKQNFLGLAQMPTEYRVILCNAKIDEGFYVPLLQATRFSLASVRNANSFQTRCVEHLANGVITVIPREHAMPFLFSEDFACFQTYRNDHVSEDITAIVGDYDGIITRLIPQLEQLEAEACDLFPTYKARALRHLRQVLFHAHVEKPTARKPNTSSRRMVAINTPMELMLDWDAAARHAELTRPLDAGRPADWLRLAESLLAPWQDALDTKHLADQPSLYDTALGALEEGLSHHPNSLALRYAQAVALRRRGDITAACAGFASLDNPLLSLYHSDLFPRLLDRWHGFFWTCDARIRERVAGLAVTAPERAVWLSYAHSHLADMTLTNAFKEVERAHDPHNTVPNEAFLAGLTELAAALHHAETALSHFSLTEPALRTYLRSLYALHRATKGLPDAVGDWRGLFLAGFTAARITDTFVLNDLGPLAYDLLLEAGRREEAEMLRQERDRFLDRVAIGNASYTLYPEVIPLLRQHGLAHGTTQEINLHLFRDL